MATKDKLPNLEILKASHDFLEQMIVEGVAVKYQIDFTSGTYVWSQGGYNTNSGQATGSTHALYNKRIRFSLADFKTSIGIKVVCPNGIEASVLKYDADDTYKNDYVPMTGNEIFLFEPNTKYRVSAKYSDDSDILPEAGNDISICVYGTMDADATLTYRRQLNSNDNLDNITKQGMYRWLSGSRPVGSPTTVGATMLVMGLPSASRQVVFTPTAICFRGNTTGGWTETWTSVAAEYKTLIAHWSLANNTDLDTVLESGMYGWLSTTNIVNAPIATGVAGRLVVFNPGLTNPSMMNRNDMAFQVLYYANGSTYFRINTTSGFLPWNRILTDTDISKETKDITVDGFMCADETGHKMSIGPSNTWTTPTNASGTLGHILPVPSGVKKISMVVPNGAVYAFLKSYSTPIAGESPDFSSVYKSRILASDSGYVEYRVTDEIQYMYCLVTSSNGTDMRPTNLKFHYDYVPEKLQEIPTLYLNGDTTGMSKENAVTMDYSFFGQTGTCTVKWQGSSSQRYVKKNYTITFDTGFDAWTKWATFVNSLRSRNGNISTMPTASRWGSQTKYCAKANWIDPSAARNIVCARLWGQIVSGRVTAGDVTDNRKDAPNYGAIDGFPIEIMINNETAGLYTLNIPKDGWQFGMGEGAAEYVVSGESNSSNACKWKGTALVDGTDYSVEYAPNGDSDASAIASSLNTAISAAISAGENWETELASYVDVDSVIDYFIFTCCVSNNDALARNILYGTYDGTKWFMSAYDLDTTFGSDPYGTSWFPVEGSRTNFAAAADMHQLAYLMYTYSSAKLKARYQELRQGVLSEGNVWKELSNFIVNIPVLDYEIDRKRWPSAPGTATAKLAQYMEFYRMHCAYLDAEIAAL